MPIHTPTERNSAAASANGQLARNSAMSSCKSGFTAASVVICTEDAAQFEALRAAYHRQVRPRTQVESDLLDIAITALWRKRRVLAMVAAAHDLEMKGLAPADPNLRLLQRHDGRLTRDFIHSWNLLCDFLSDPAPIGDPAHEPRATSNEPPSPT